MLFWWISYIFFQCQPEAWTQIIAMDLLLIHWLGPLFSCSDNFAHRKSLMKTFEHNLFVGVEWQKHLIGWHVENEIYNKIQWIKFAYFWV